MAAQGKSGWWQERTRSEATQEHTNKPQNDKRCFLRVTQLEYLAAGQG